MEKQIDIMKRSIELIETVIEGFIHIQKRLNEGHFEETIYLVEDSLIAFSYIESSLNTLPNHVLSQNGRKYVTNARNAIEIVVSSYEEKNYPKVQAVLQFTLVPTIKRWKTELDESFKSYLVS